jgi:hypothetical protein
MTHNGGSSVSKASELLQAERKPRSLPLDEWLATLDADDREAILAARYNVTDYSHAAMSRVFTALGRPTGKDTISEWRNG